MRKKSESVLILLYCLFFFSFSKILIITNVNRQYYVVYAVFVSKVMRVICVLIVSNKKLILLKVFILLCYIVTVYSVNRKWNIYCIGISKQLTLFWCRGCGRYQRTPQWVDVTLESRELLALCLKKIKGKIHSYYNITFIIYTTEYVIYLVSIRYDGCLTNTLFGGVGGVVVLCCDGDGVVVVVYRAK